MLNRDQFVRLLGKQPEHCPLDVQTLEETDCSSYSRHLIEYTTEPNERVQAFLLVLKLLAPVGAILAIHQDGSHRPYEFGKSEPAGIAGDPEMAYGKELAERGYVVICPDRFPFESRMLAHSIYAATFELFKVTGLDGDRPFDLTEDLYHGCMANKLLFEGRTMQGKTLHELQRAIDVLCSLPYVDAERLGVIGHSAGGFHSLMLMYIDERIKVGCSSCGLFLMTDNFKNDYLRPINGFSWGLIPGMKELGDMDDLLTGLAPRPFLDTDGDFSGDEGQFHQLHAKAKARYEKMGIPERYTTIAYGAGHVFRKDMRERCYQWFDRWFEES